jgi:hypothetical protein
MENGVDEAEVTTALKVICSSIDLVLQPFHFVASMAHSYLGLESNDCSGIIRCLGCLFCRYLVQPSLSKSPLAQTLASLFTFDEAALQFMKENNPALFHQPGESQSAFTYFAWLYCHIANYGGCHESLTGCRLPAAMIALGPAFAISVQFQG